MECQIRSPIPLNNWLDLIAKALRLIRGNSVPNFLPANFLVLPTLTILSLYNLEAINHNFKASSEISVSKDHKVMI